MATLADSSTRPRTKSVHSTNSKCFMRFCPSGEAQTHARSRGSLSLFGVCAPDGPRRVHGPAAKVRRSECSFRLSYRGCALNRRLPQVRVEILSLSTRRALGMEPPEHARDSNLAIQGVNNNFLAERESN